MKVKQVQVIIISFFLVSSIGCQNNEHIIVFNNMDSLYSSFTTIQKELERRNSYHWTMYSNKYYFIKILENNQQLIDTYFRNLRLFKEKTIEDEEVNKERYLNFVSEAKELIKQFGDTASFYSGLNINNRFIFNESKYIYTDNWVDIASKCYLLKADVIIANSNLNLILQLTRDEKADLEIESR